MVQKSWEEFLQQILGCKKNVPNMRLFTYKGTETYYHTVIVSLFGFLRNPVVSGFSEEDLQASVQSNTPGSLKRARAVSSILSVLNPKPVKFCVGELPT